MVVRILILCGILFCRVELLFGQDSINHPPEQIKYSVNGNGDTLFYVTMREVFIFPENKTMTRSEQKHYTKLIYNVKKVYPYAKLAGNEYALVEEDLLNLKTDKERREYVRQLEDTLMSKYEDELKNLTITQGRILLKLVDREIGETSYDILKELKGTVTAVFWQTLARIFGNNLKSGFDPEGEDKLLNDILIQIDSGML
jgi:hypothetical protein